MITVLEWVRAHQCAPPLSLDALSKILNGPIGITFTPQIREIYSTCNGARWRTPEGDTIGVLPIEKVERARVAIYGADSDDYGSPSVYAFFQYGDSDFVGVNTAISGEDGECNVVDCWHESFADNHSPEVIASTVFDFLRRIMQGGCKKYWLH